MGVELIKRVQKKVYYEITTESGRFFDFRNRGLTGETGLPGLPFDRRWIGYNDVGFNTGLRDRLAAYFPTPSPWEK